MSLRLLLASQSPRRAELLKSIRVEFDQRAVDIDESVNTNEMPIDYLQRIVKAKYDAAIDFYQDKYDLILTADTSVICGEIIMGKPVDEAQARYYLEKLSGNIHQVSTAICLNGDVEIITSDVEFRELQLEEITRYWLTGEPHGKAGAYAIQGIGSIFVRSIQGSHSNIVGLPLFETAALLAKHGKEVLPC